MSIQLAGGLAASLSRPREVPIKARPNAGTEAAATSQDRVEIGLERKQRLESSQTYANGRIRSTSYAESNTKVNADGSLDRENPSLKGRFEAGQSYKLGNETEIDVNDDTTIYRKHEVSVNSGGKAAVEVTNGTNRQGINQAQSVEAAASSDVKNVTTNGVKSKDGTFAEWESEQKVYADSHGKAESKVVVNQYEITISSGFDVPNEAGASDKETLRIGTPEGTQAEVFGEGSYAAGGSAKGGVLFSRQNDEGTTEFGLYGGGPVPVVPGLGLGGGFRIKIKDQDLEKALELNKPTYPTGAWQQASKHLQSSDLLTTTGSQLDSWA